MTSPRITSNQRSGVLTVACNWHQFKRLFDRLNAECIRFTLGRDRLTIRILDMRQRNINAAWVVEACR